MRSHEISEITIERSEDRSVYRVRCTEAAPPHRVAEFLVTDHALQTLPHPEAFWRDVLIHAQAGLIWDGLPAGEWTPPAEAIEGLRAFREEFYRNADATPLRALLARFESIEDAAVWDAVTIDRPEVDRHDHER